MKKSLFCRLMYELLFTSMTKKHTLYMMDRIVKMFYKLSKLSNLNRSMQNKRFVFRYVSIHGISNSNI